MRNLFLALAGYCLATRPTAPLELLGLPELLNVPFAGAKALPVQQELYRRAQLSDIRGLPTRSLRGVVLGLDFVIDHGRRGRRLQLCWRSARLAFAVARIGPARRWTQLVPPGEIEYRLFSR